MSLHITLSTTCPDTNRLGGWKSAGLSVEFFCGGRYGSIEPGTAEIEKHFNSDAGNLLVVDPQRDKHSGRYRQR
ncbi:MULTISPECIES: hypothetical protein [unclassified Coleofasciculus]|uniref:hypothetical protein n=1 Tax=unclassified Coleofasciculus TaxID=2692782 RepID=UPI00187E3934|nr:MULTISPECIES: hypothetical protein [unclassified Coleofasciculus]MBE9130232.1 hypothetical protein [Coleofasciculus sp. LEGE 07081]MBE9152531.1 hypothetical protein [Coleofasciculus sp. LEGE 07092]